MTNRNRLHYLDNNAFMAAIKRIVETPAYDYVDWNRWCDSEEEDIPYYGTKSHFLQNGVMRSCTIIGKKTSGTIEMNIIVDTISGEVRLMRDEDLCELVFETENIATTAETSPVQETVDLEFDVMDEHCGEEDIPFKDFLRNERIKCGISQSALAKKIGVSPDAVSNWENGRNYPSTNKFKFIANALGVDLKTIKRIFDNEKAKLEAGVLDHTQDAAFKERVASVGTDFECFSDFLKSAVDASGVNKVQFANNINVSPSRLSKWLSGTHFPSEKSIKGIAFKLGVDEKKLLSMKKKGDDGIQKELFCDFIKEQRKNRKMTLEQFCKFIGVSSSTLWHWENGNKMPQKQRLQNVLKKLGIDGNSIAFTEKGSTAKNENNPYETELSKMILEARVNKRLDKTQFASMMKISKDMVDSWENGISVPKVEKTGDIVRVLGLDYNDYRTARHNVVNQESVGSRIAKARKSIGYTQSDLDELLDLAPSTTKGIENGDAGSVPLSLRNKYAEALGITF